MRGKHKIKPIVLGIDPGTNNSGVVLFDPNIPAVLMTNGAMPNNEVMSLLNDMVGPAVSGNSTIVALEVIKAIYSGHVGKETIQTIRFTGAVEAVCEIHKLTLFELSPQEVKAKLCHAPSAKDPAVRQALIDRFGPVGTKTNPGALHGVHSHAWRALAVAVAVSDLVS